MLMQTSLATIAIYTTHHGAHEMGKNLVMVTGWILVICLVTLWIVLCLWAVRKWREYLSDEPTVAESTVEQLVETFCASVELKDTYTRGHSERVTAYLLFLARHIYGCLSKEETVIYRYSGLLHDVGKITIPEAILRKPGKLSREEMHVMRGHTETGALLVGRIPHLARVVPIIRHHHERFDGKGYPDGLAGNQIPFAARVAAVADTFDALTSTRTYQKARDLDLALQEIIANSGTQFDPAIVSVFVQEYDGLRQLYHDIHQQVTYSDTVHT